MVAARVFIEDFLEANASEDVRGNASDFCYSRFCNFGWEENE